METINLPGKTALNPIAPARDLETLALPGKPTLQYFSSITAAIESIRAGVYSFEGSSALCADLNEVGYDCQYSGGIIHVLGIDTTDSEGKIIYVSFSTPSNFASLIDYTPEETARKASALRSKAAQYREMARVTKNINAAGAYHEEADAANAEAYRLEIQPPNIAAQVAELRRQARVKRDLAGAVREEGANERDTLTKSVLGKLAAQYDLQAADREREADRIEATQEYRCPKCGGVKSGDDAWCNDCNAF